MKPLLLPLTLTLVFLATPIAQAENPKEGAAGGDGAAIQRFVDEFAAAFTANDAEAADRLTTPDYTFVTPAGAVQNGEQRLAPLRSGDLKYELVKYDEVKIRVYGDAAVVTARVTVKSKLKGTDIGGLFRSTLMLVRTPAGWRLAASQANAIAQP